MAVFILYYPVLTTYFSQDDFFHFKVSQTDGSLKSFLNLFNFHKFEERGIAFYRPISREAPFNLYYQIFNLNHLPFRLFMFLIHFLNIFLVFQLIQKLFGKRMLSYFVAFFFGITSANISLLFYIAGGVQTLLATSFTLLSLLPYLNYLQKFNLKFLLLTFLFFLLGLGSHEQSVIIPLLLLGVTFIYTPKIKLKIAVTKLIPFFIILFTFIYLDITKIGFSQTEKQYQPTIEIKIVLNSFFWYSGWAFGLPEMLIDFVNPGFKLNPNLMRYWGNYYKVIFPSFFLSLTLLIAAFIYLLFKDSKIFFNKNLIFLFFWLPLGMIPVIFLPLHKSTHYLAIVLPPFWGILGYTIFNSYQIIRREFVFIANIWLLTLLLSLFILSATSIKLGSQNYWAAERGKIAQRIIEQVKSAYPTIPKGSIIYFKNDPNYPFLTKEWGGTSRQTSFILNGSDALQLLYKDPTIRVFYEDLDGVPQNFQKKVYEIVAKVE